MPKAIAIEKGVYRPYRYEDKVADSGALAFVYGDEIPIPPKKMPRVAKKKWIEKLMHAKQLYGYISFLDLDILEEYCYCYAEVVDFRTQKISPTDPLFKIFDEKRKYLVFLAREFGWTPSSRKNVELVQALDEKKTDDYSEFT